MKLTDKDLVRAIEIAESLAESAGDLQQNRADALKSYLGENTLPAPEGRSQIVDRSVFDTIEAAKPAVLEPFLAGDEVVKFDPVGPEDEEQADQETAYVNHIILAKNPGHQILDAWFHDAALQKVGYVKAFWHEADETVRERYSGLTDNEMAMLAADTEVEIVEHEEIPDPYVMPPQPGQPPQPPSMLHNVVLARKSEYGCVKIENVPPENVLVDHNARNVSVAQCDFFEHWEMKTISQLRAEGFDVDDDIADDRSSNTYEDSQRDHQRPLRNTDTGEEPDPSMRRVCAREVWMRIDENGDGIAELRHYHVVGKTILDKDDADMIPVAAFCPIPLAHQHYGQSYYDVTKEVEQTKTSLTRASLDNCYLAVNGRHAVDLSRVNLDDMLQSRPGGIVRVEGEPGSAIMPLTSPATYSVALEMNEYMDTVRETRTGITRYAQGVMDPNGLNKTATGINAVFSAQQARTRLVTRRFADAFKELCLIVHAITLKHARKPEIFRLRNTWVPVDPRSWVNRKDVSVTVGLGTGNKQEQAMFLHQMLEIVFGPAGQLGLTDGPHAYHVLAELTKAAGFPNPSKFWIDPTGQPPPPPPPDPKMVEVQQKGQIEQAKLQFEQQKGGQELQMRGQEMQQDAQLAMAEAQAKMQLEREKMQMQIQLEREKMQLQMELEKLKAAIQAQTSLQTAGMQAQQEGEAKQADASGMQSLVGTLSENFAQLLAQTQQNNQAIAEAVSRPKKVVRGSDGKISGVQ